MGRLFALFQISGIQVSLGGFLFSAIRHQLDERILLVVLLIDLLIDGCHALGRCHNGILVDGNIRIRLSASMRTGNFGIQLIPNGIKALGVRFHEVILDLNFTPGSNKLLQTLLIFLGEQLVLTLFEKLRNFGVHGIQGIDICLDLGRKPGISALLSGLLHLRKTIPCASG